MSNNAEDKTRSTSFRKSSFHSFRSDNTVVSPFSPFPAPGAFSQPEPLKTPSTYYHNISQEQHTTHPCVFGDEQPKQTGQIIKFPNTYEKISPQFVQGSGYNWSTCNACNISPNYGAWCDSNVTDARLMNPIPNYNYADPLYYYPLPKKKTIKEYFHEKFRKIVDKLNTL